MKCFVFSAFAFVAVWANSCSQFPEDKRIKELVLAHERPNFIKFRGDVDGPDPCWGFKAYEIPKEYTKISTLTGRDPRASNFERDMEISNSILEKMALNGLITMTRISDESDETFTNKMGQLVNVKKYKIDLTSKGNESTVGSTGDNFVVALFDLKDIEIVQKDEKANDTLFVLYNFKRTPFYEVLAEVCDTTKLPNALSNATLVKQNDTWVVR